SATMWLHRPSPVHLRDEALAGPQVPGWLPGMPYAARGAGRDDVTGLEGDDRGDVLDEVDRVEQQIAGVVLLHRLTVEFGGDVQLGAHAAGQLARGAQVRPERGGGLPGLAPQPLLRAVLPIPAGLPAGGGTLRPVLARQQFCSEEPYAHAR